MISVTVFRRCFTSSWQMLCLALLSMSLLSSLGVWQLHRAAEKQALLNLYQAQIHHPAVTFPGTKAHQYQMVEVTGVSQLPMTVLLDNQHHNHQFGYDVLTPMLVADGRVLLVDHGWVPGDPSRTSLPDISQMQLDNPVRGQVYYPANQSWVLGVGLEMKKPNMVVIESINLPMLSQFLHKPIYPFIIRESEQSQTRYVRDWPVVAGSPVRHYGYAAQWFIFALGAGVMFIILHTKRL